MILVIPSYGILTLVQFPYDHDYLGMPFAYSDEKHSNYDNTPMQYTAIFHGCKKTVLFQIFR